jgi:hypothetical protein
MVFNNNFLMVGSINDPRTVTGGAALMAEALQSYADRFISYTHGSTMNKSDFSVVDYWAASSGPRSYRGKQWNQGPDGLRGSIATDVVVDDHEFYIQRLKGQPNLSYDELSVKGSSFAANPTISADLCFSRWAHYIPTAIWDTWKATDFGDYYHAYAFIHCQVIANTAVGSATTRNGVTSATGMTADEGWNDFPWQMERLIYIDPTDWRIKCIRQENHTATTWTESYFTDPDRCEDITARVLNWHFGTGMWRHEAINPAPPRTAFSFDVRNCKLPLGSTTQQLVATSTYANVAGTNDNWYGQQYPDGSGVLMWCRAGSGGWLMPKPFMQTTEPRMIPYTNPGAVDNAFGTAALYARGIAPSVSGLWVEGYDTDIAPASEKQIMFIPYEEGDAYQNDTTNGHSKDKYWGNLAYRAPSTTRIHVATLGERPVGYTVDDWFSAGIYVDPAETYMLVFWLMGYNSAVVERYDINTVGPTLTYVSSGSFAPQDLSGFAMAPVTSGISVDSSGNILFFDTGVNDTKLAGNRVETGDTPTKASTAYGWDDRLVYQFKMNDVTDPTAGFTYVGGFYFTGENGGNNRATYDVPHGPPHIFYDPRSCAAKVPTFSANHGGWQMGRNNSGSNDVVWWHPTNTSMDVI